MTPAELTAEDIAHCRKCAYSSSAHLFESSMTCDYILIEEHSRGCPPGLACDKYTPRRGRRRNKMPRLFPRKEDKPKPPQESKPRTRFPRYNFPTVSITKTVFYFNQHCIAEITQHEYFRVCSAGDYILFLPTSPGPGAMHLNCVNGGYVLHVPAALKPALNRGVYKLMRCKGGYCFNRYQPVKKKMDGGEDDAAD